MNQSVVWPRNVMIGLLGLHIVMTLSSTACAASSSGASRMLGTCLAVARIQAGDPSVPGAGTLVPEQRAADHFRLDGQRELDAPSPDAARLLRAPRHGLIDRYRRPNSDESLGWRYVPTPGYTGNDRAEFAVDIEGEKVRVIYFLKVTALNLDDGSADQLCKGRAAYQIRR